MTDKPIYLDGVDVSKCRYFLKDTEGQDYDTDEFVKGCCEAKGSCIGYEFAGYGLCRGDKDCYFKQLARKTQECESLKEEIEVLKDNFDTATRDCNELIEELKQECEEYKKRSFCFKDVNKQLGYKYLTIKQECEELKERLERTEEDLKYQCVDCMNIKSDRYCKALEEIEEIASKDYYDDTWADISIKIDKILDIINEAKGGV